MPLRLHPRPVPLPPLGVVTTENLVLKRLTIEKCCFMSVERTVPMTCLRKEALVLAGMSSRKLQDGS